MPATPRRAQRAPKPGSRFPSQVVAENMRQLRALRRMSQSHVADQMTRLGHNWAQKTVSAAETGERHLNVDELVSLALVLETSVPSLLDPVGPADPALRWEVPADWNGSLDMGTTFPLPARFAKAWLRGEVNALLVVQGDETRIRGWWMTATQDDESPTDAEQ